MLLKMKVYLIGSLYLLGALFMLLFPPRNFKQSGAKMKSIRSTGSVLEYTHYLDYKEMISITSQMVHGDPELVRLVKLQPPSSENRSIIAIELRSDKHSQKPGILIVGALDGMAWGVPNAIIELADRLIHDSSYQTPYFNDYDWYLVPLANPDGLELTHRLRDLAPVDPIDWSRNLSTRPRTRPATWHKNIQKDSDHPCYGTHINRNFAYHWQDDLHKAPDRCSQYYPGARPFSAPEAQALRAYVDKHEQVIDLAIHLHASYVPKKDLMLYPWRYTHKVPSNAGTLQAIGEYAARQARLPDGRVYEVHQGIAEGRVAGSISDYISGVVGTELVFILKPYHPMYPNFTDVSVLETFVKKATSAVLSLVRGWRKNMKQNTLSFFGVDIEF